MSRLAQKRKDSFKPGIFDRLKQSQEARQLTRERKTPKKKIPDAPPPTQIHESTGGGFFRNDVTWRVWNTGGGTLATTTCVDNDPWYEWNTRITVTSAATTSNIWYDWNRNHVVTAGPTTIGVWQEWVDQDPQLGPRRIIQTHRQVETPEQRRVREEQEQRYRAEREAENALYYEQQRAAENRRKEAEDRAMKLLVSMLNEQQKADLKRDKHFFVDAPSGRLYRIDYGTHGNVKVVDRQTRKIVERLCIQPNGVPAGDANLMQKLLIETAEDLFRAHANITLEDGRILYGKTEPITGDKLAEVIPIRRAA
jgi:hypothetical protein